MRLTAGRCSQEVLLSMAGELRHRGPDETGLYLSRSFGMVNTRLAISDPEHARARGDERPPLQSQNPLRQHEQVPSPPRSRVHGACCCRRRLSRTTGREAAGRVPLLRRARARLRQKPLLRKATKRLLPAAIHGRRKVPYRAPIVRAFVGRAAPEYVRDLLRPNRLAEAGIFDPSLAQAVVAKCERQADTGVAETEEIALVGILSSMLLHEQFIARPVLASPLTPQRRIVEDAQAIRQPATI